jgi:hypothetical protein
MSITGHRTESVYRRDDIVSDRDLKLAATKMETYLGEQRPEPSPRRWAQYEHHGLATGH